ncbi:unnamed protein product [Fusarium graminearum]|nr:unnamed protein product [Fusarium graminearum]
MRSLPNLETPATGSRQRLGPFHLDNDFSPNDTLLSPPVNTVYQSETGRSILTFGTIESVHDGGISRLTASQQQLARAYETTDDSVLIQYCMTPQNKPVTVESLSADFWHAAEVPAHRKGDEFLPLDKLKSLINPHTVRELLESLNPKPQVESLIRGIFPPRLPLEFRSPGQREDYSEHPTLCRIFAILVGVNRVMDIQSFIDHGINDSALPFITATEEEKQSGIQLRSAGDPDMDNSKLSLCFERFSEMDLKFFKMYQRLINVPFFLFPREDSTVYFYELDESCVLPITDVGKPKSGGNGSVKMIKIHPSHHNYGKNAKEHSNTYFAVKKLHFQNDDMFKKEVEVFERLAPKSKDGSPDHLVHLELAYRHGEECCLVFPWASGNLKEYWKSHRKDPNNPDHVLWFFKQCRGLALGLSRLHNPRSYADTTTSMNSNVHTTKKIQGYKYGRHGDIKPENILWFDNYNGDPDHLAVCDFGSTEFNNLDTKSHVHPSLVRGYSITYQPPDSHTETEVSQKFDIWSLGCVFLEFVSWFLLGHDPTMDEFTRERMETNPRHSNGVVSQDQFFHLEHSWRPGRKLIAKVNPGVLKVDQTYAAVGNAKTIKRSGGTFHFLAIFDFRSISKSRSKRIQEKPGDSGLNTSRHQSHFQHPNIFPTVAEEMLTTPPTLDEFERDIRDQSEAPNPRRNRHSSGTETHNRESILPRMHAHQTTGTTGSSNVLLQMTTGDANSYSTRCTTPCLTDAGEVDVNLRNSISENPKDDADQGPCEDRTIQNHLRSRQNSGSRIIAGQEDFCRRNLGTQSEHRKVRRRTMLTQPAKRLLEKTKTVLKRIPSKLGSTEKASED